MRPLRIATRKSPLALWQAHHVAARLRALSPGRQVSLLELSTEGDRFLGAPLSQVGGKGLFVKEIEQALLDRSADIAVHSLKDMTSALPDGLILAAVSEREDPRDAFVGRKAKTVAGLRVGAIVGTASLRRSCLLRARRPDLAVKSVRGNVQTRLSKLEAEDLDGLVLALAGLRRLGLEARVTEVLSVADSLPAVGQGVVAIECREEDSEVRGLLAGIEHAETRIAVVAERAFLKDLEGGCSVPLAGHATVEGGRVWLRGLVGRPDGTQVIQGELRGPASDAEALGRALAKTLLGQGAGAILAAHRKPSGNELT